MPESLGSLRAAIMLSVAASGTALLGALILLGGSVRFSTIGFSVARQVAPWWVWGLVMFGAGLVALVGIITRHPWWCRFGHTSASIAYLFLMITFIQTAAQAANAALTGIGVYLCLAVLHALGAATADVRPVDAGRG